MKNEIDIKSIIREGALLYKNNFVKLVIISSVLMVLTLCIQIWEATVGAYLNNSTTITAGLINMVVPLVIITISTIGNIYIILVANNMYKKEMVKIKENIIIAKTKFWRYIGNGILIILILLIPLIIFNGIILSSLSIIPKVILAIAFSLPIIYLVTSFSFVIYLVCLDETGASRLGKSRELCRGVFYKVFILHFLIGGVLDYGFFIIHTIIERVPITSLLINNTIYALSYGWLLLVTPLSCCMSIVLLYKLLPLKDMVLKVEDNDMQLIK